MLASLVLGEVEILARSSVVTDDEDLLPTIHKLLFPHDATTLGAQGLDGGPVVLHYEGFPGTCGFQDLLVYLSLLLRYFC